MQNVATVYPKKRMANSIVLEDIKKKYQQLRRVALTDAGKTSLAHFFNEIKFRNDFPRSALDARDAYILGVRLAHALTEEEFINVLLQGQMPAIKLSKFETQVLRSGIVKDSLTVLPLPPEYYLNDAGSLEA